jgi:hypothetical protein
MPIRKDTTNEQTPYESRRHRCSGVSGCTHFPGNALAEVLKEVLSKNAPRNAFATSRGAYQKPIEEASWLTQIVITQILAFKYSARITRKA